MATIAHRRGAGKRDGEQSRPTVRPTVPTWYTIPDPLRSLESWQRYVHQDLRRMSARELWLEQRRVEFALMHHEGRERDATWLWGRLARVRAERGRRLRAVPR